MKKTLLRKYAKAIVRIGANVQKGQSVRIDAEVSNEEFVALVVDEAYKAGAKKVRVNWSSDAVTEAELPSSDIENPFDGGHVAGGKASGGGR